MTSNALNFWTVYYNPSDYPGKYVARRALATEPPTMTTDVLLADSLDKIRAMLPPGLYWMKRWEGDDPVIVETWI